MKAWMLLVAAFAAAISALGEVGLFTGAVYEFPKKDVCASANSTYYVNVPVYDSPCLLAERSALELAGTP